MTRRACNSKRRDPTDASRMERDRKMEIDDRLKMTNWMSEMTIDHNHKEIPNKKLGTAYHTHHSKRDTTSDRVVCRMGQDPFVKKKWHKHAGISRSWKVDTNGHIKRGKMPTMKHEWMVDTQWGVGPVMYEVCEYLKDRETMMKIELEQRRRRSPNDDKNVAKCNSPSGCRCWVVLFLSFLSFQFVAVVKRMTTISKQQRKWTKWTKDHTRPWSMIWRFHASVVCAREMSAPGTPGAKTCFYFPDLARSAGSL